MRAYVSSLVLALALGLGAAPAAAQPAQVPDLIKVIENQPSDMDRSTWKEKRRDAARKLAQSKDKRGVPVLIKLAETETFDIIGEIAIEGLGAIGDQSAVPTLQAIVADTTRDKASRDLAKRALAKLGAPETGGASGGTKTGGGTTTTTTTTATTTTPPPTGGGGKTGGGAATNGGGTKTGGGNGGTRTGGGDTGGGGGTSVATGGGDSGSGLETGGGLSDTSGGGGGLTDTTGSGSGLLGDKPATTIEGAPELDDDVIAASNRLTFAIGTLGFRYQKTPSDDGPPQQSPDSRLDFDADVAAYYQRRLDTETKAYRIDADARLVAGMINPEGSSVSRAVVFSGGVSGEARFYSNKLYGVGKAAVSGAVTNLSLTEVDFGGGNVTTVKNTSSQLDVQVALGGGYGRIVDVGGAIRVRRLARILDNARALGKPIDAGTAKRLQTTWWALRGERVTFRSLIATIAILREAGILLGEPNAALTYEILTVLRDTQLYMRPQGLDAQLVIGEGYLKRPSDDMDNCRLASCGRVEQVIAKVGIAEQMNEDKLEVGGDAWARYRLFAPDDPATPTPWAAGFGGRMRRFTYGPHGDPFGALDVAGRVQFSNDGFAMDPFGFDSDTAMRLEAEAGFTYWVNQASGLRLAAQLVVDQGTYFLGGRLEGTYGLLDGIFAR